MSKKMVSIRMPEELLKQAGKIAEKNKAEYKHPNSISGIVLEGLIEYLIKQGNKK